MKLFLQKNARFSSALPPNPQSPAAGGSALRPQTPIGPQTAPPLRISGYAPARGGVEDTRLEAKAKVTKQFRGQGQTLSRPRPWTKNTDASVLQKKRSLKIFFRQKRSLKVFFQTIST